MIDTRYLSQPGIYVGESRSAILSGRLALQAVSESGAGVRQLQAEDVDVRHRVLAGRPETRLRGSAEISRCAAAG
ncbi:hypothetical protein [Pectobacterium atrosepticum]|uniref:hypothetical protein n=1 Tax=Pectobacterium atrosepticum TaxID=29471 RepID=UPI0030170D9A